MMRTHLLQVVGDGAPGGGTTVVLGLSRSLRDRGFPVTIASQRNSYLLAEAQSAGLDTLELDFRSRAHSPRIAALLRNRLRDMPPTVVHAHGARAGLPAAMLPSPSRAAFVYTVHGFHYVNKPPGVRHLARLTERFCAGRASETVFVSRRDRELALRDSILDPSKPHRVIYNGAPTPAAAEGRKRYDIAFVGRLHQQKNPLLLAGILRALRPARPSLCIVGGGEQEAALRDRIAQEGLGDQVSFLGTQPHCAALAALSRARVMVLPSLWEGLPVSVIEAMHLRIPVVASGIPGTAEVVEDGRTGFLVPPGDAGTYADRLRLLLEDGDLHSRMGEAAAERARSTFSLQQHIAGHVDLYEHLAGAPVRSGAFALAG